MRHRRWGLRHGVGWVFRWGLRHGVGDGGRGGGDGGCDHGGGKLEEEEEGECGLRDFGWVVWVGDDGGGDDGCGDDG
ncbi:hypothetical protein Tco_1508469 [Tanacetum coccineum]